jgi:hypothetical protein
MAQRAATLPARARPMVAALQDVRQGPVNFIGS